MLKHLIFVLFLSIGLRAGAQQVKIVTFDKMGALIKGANDTTYVVNFWASWCKPCVHELPNFGKIDSMYRGKKVKVILVSLDFVKEVHTRLEPFLKQNNILSTVWLLNDPDYNSWI